MLESGSSLRRPITPLPHCISPPIHTVAQETSDAGGGLTSWAAVRNFTFVAAAGVVGEIAALPAATLRSIYPGRTGLCSPIHSGARLRWSSCWW